jgi:hypothetical protein
MRQWARDLGMGVRFALAGGREGWIRVALTGIGVGLGVALLLLTAALPNALSERDRREEARDDSSYVQIDKPAENTLLVGRVSTTFHDEHVRGRQLDPEGPKAPLPPGLSEFPKPGEMVVSPALKELLASDEGKLLRERLPYKVVGTIAEEGLIGNGELAYYAGAEGLIKKYGDGDIGRIDHFGRDTPSQNDPLDPILLLLILVALGVLMTPVAVFIAASVRFGGERRDRRLAALRLVGSDARMARRIAAGEALAGSLAGLVLGAGFFLIGRHVAGTVSLFGTSFFPSYLNPSPVLAVLVAVLVPASAVLVTQVALRSVVIEPLGVVRAAKPTRRRLWWRLLLPVAGFGMLYPMIGQGGENGNFNPYLTIGGVMFLLIGVTALLPWVVETVVARLGSGPVAWQLAVRRLQVSSSTAARLVNGIAVAVAGAIALQMLFVGVGNAYTDKYGSDSSSSHMVTDTSIGEPGQDVARMITETPGVERVHSIWTGNMGDHPKDPDNFLQVAVGSCEALRTAARIDTCRDGDVFLLEDAETDPGEGELMKPGTKLWYNRDEEEDGEPASEPQRADRPAWTVPEKLIPVTRTADSRRVSRRGLMLTPKAAPEGMKAELNQELFIRLDGTQDAFERTRTTLAKINPYVHTEVLTEEVVNSKFVSIRNGVLLAATGVLILIGLSLLVSQLEQLRERRKLLASLVAFGTKRSTLGLSVLWQAAVPVALGLLLAVGVGVSLGSVLLKMTTLPVSVDWSGVAMMAGAGALVVLAVTALSLPPLMRIVRPDGLRTE